MCCLLKLSPGRRAMTSFVPNGNDSMVKSLKPLFAPIEVPSFVDDKSSVPVADVAAPSSPTSID